MIPRHLIHKLIQRNGSNLLRSTNSFVTSAVRLNTSDGKKGNDNLNSSSKVQQNCGETNKLSHLEKTEVKKQENIQSQGDNLLGGNKQGTSSCGPISSTLEYKLEETEKKFSTPLDREGYGGSGHMGSTDCNCPPYATPKCAVENVRKNASGCKENPIPLDSLQMKMSETGCGPDLKVGKQNCETQKTNGSCWPVEKKSANCGHTENETCTNEGLGKWNQYYGPILLPDRETCKEYNVDKCDPHTCRPTCSDHCDVEDTKHCHQPEASMQTGKSCLETESRGTDVCDPCTPVAKPEETCSNECNDNFQASKSGYCGTNSGMEKNDCPKTKEESVCHAENKPSQDMCGNERKPECSPPKVDSAKECSHDLREIQREWQKEEEFITSKNPGTHDHQGPKTSKPREPANKHKQSTMLYPVLCAILAAVTYYAYTGDFEPEHLFVEREEIGDDNDNDDNEEN